MKYCNVITNTNVRKISRKSARRSLNSLKRYSTQTSIQIDRQTGPGTKLNKACKKLKIRMTENTKIVCKYLEVENKKKKKKTIKLISLSIFLFL